MTTTTTAAALALGALLALHSRSEGRSSFSVDELGRVAIEIQLGELDLPELCNVDLSVRGKEAEARERLARFLERELAGLVRIRGDGKPCPVVYLSHTLDAGTLDVRAAAQCSALPKKSLVIDWGLFAGGGLDHVSVAKIEQPHAPPKLAMLSRRASHLVVDIEGPLWPKVAAGVAAALVVVVAGGGVAWRIVKRRRLSAKSSAGAAQSPG